jgi:hypothetical protein
MTVAACCGSTAVATRSGSVAVTACCDPTAAAALRGPSPAAVAVLPAAHDALDERRLVGTAASDLNTLVGARGHGGRHPANAKTRKLNSRSSQRCGIWGSGRLPQGGESPLPLPRGLGGCCGRGRRGHRRTPSHLRGAHRHHCGAHHLSRSLPGGGCSCARPEHCLLCLLRGPGQGGRRLPPLGESPPPIAPLLSRQRVFRCRWGREPLLLRSQNSSSHCSRRSRRRILFSFLCTALSCSCRCAARVRAWARGVGGSDCAASTAITCKGRVKLRVTTTPRRSIEKRGAGIHSPMGRSGA